MDLFLRVLLAINWGLRLFPPLISGVTWSGMFHWTEYCTGLYLAKLATSSARRNGKRQTWTPCITYGKKRSPIFYIWWGKIESCFLLITGWESGHIVYVLPVLLTGWNSARTRCLTGILAPSCTSQWMLYCGGWLLQITSCLTIRGGKRKCPLRCFDGGKIESMFLQNITCAYQVDSFWLIRSGAYASNQEWCLWK